MTNLVMFLVEDDKLFTWTRDHQTATTAIILFVVTPIIYGALYLLDKFFKKIKK